MTVLTLLWRNHCRPVASTPSSLQGYLETFRFPLVLLCCAEELHQPKVHLGIDVMLPGLSLADALCQELDIITEDQAVVILYPESATTSALNGLRLAAELLHALIERDTTRMGETATLFEWAFRSLSAAWHPTIGQDRELRQRRDSAIAEVLGYPAARAEMSLSSYLRILNADHKTTASDPALAARLQGCATLNEWQTALWASFDSARCRGIVDLRQN